MAPSVTEHDVEKGVKVRVSPVPESLDESSSSHKSHSFAWTNPFTKEKIQPSTDKYADPTPAQVWSWRTAVKRAVRRRKSTLHGAPTSRRCFKWLIICFMTCFLSTALVALVWGMMCLVVSIRVPRIYLPQNGFATVATQALKAQPAVLTPSEINWPDNLSGDITPVPIHSHNDEWRRVPLYEALSFGCISIEADIWLHGTDEILVGHAQSSLTPNRTLRSLYINPLLEILKRQNSSRQADGTFTGIYNQHSTQSVNLLIDMKSDGPTTYPVLLQHLQPLLDAGFLTTYDGQDLKPGALTIVGSGNSPFNLITTQPNTTHPRIVFYDAPLTKLSDPSSPYNTTNTALASAPLTNAIGIINANRLTKGQWHKLHDQIAAAKAKNIPSRYWKLPAFPVVLRDRVWAALTAEEVGLLNADEIMIASQRDWAWCRFLGVQVC